MKKAAVASQVAMLAALAIPTYFLVTRAHDYYETRSQYLCVTLDERTSSTDPSMDGRYADCGVYEKKFLYSERVWGSNKLVEPILRDDFGEFLLSLIAVVPWLAGRVLRRVGSQSRPENPANS